MFLLDPTIDRSERTTVICQHDHADISCPAGQILKIKEASYGRTDGNTCAASAMYPRMLQNTNCDACVEEIVREW